MNPGIIICFFCLLCTVDPGAECSARGIDSLEADIRRGEAEIAEIEKALARLDARMRTIARDIKKEKSHLEGSPNPIYRFRLERLLKRSRRTADEMDWLREKRDWVEYRNNRASSELLACSKKLLRIGWEELLSLIRERKYAEARGQMAALRELEARLKFLEGGGRERVYPRVSEDIIEGEVGAFEEKALLLDMMLDLREKAQEDSLLLEGKLRDVGESITLKSDLLNLLDEAGEAGVEGGIFFEEFDEDEVRFEVGKLEKEREKLKESLDKVIEVITYYRKYILVLEGVIESETR